MKNKSEKPRLLLINPVNHYRKGIYHSKEASVPPLGLDIIGALTPPHWDVELLDENFDTFDGREADLVAFTALTSQVTRAYELAAFYKKKNIPTVIGGIHASMLPDEAAKYVDVVVKGEGESAWPQVISDFERGSMKKLYEGELLPMNQSPTARHELFSDKYGLGAIQTTRGCPMKCDFCSVHVINGRKYRYRPVKDVINDFVSIPQDRVYIVDDDFYGYSKRAAQRAKDICRGIIDSGVNKTWYTFTSMHLADDEEALELMSQAGCRMILLGIESELAEQLKESDKKTNLRIGVEKYESVFKTFHKYGIAVLGSLIFGLESDTPESIINRVNFYIQSGIDCTQASILTPLPGTQIYFKLLAEDRITCKNFPKDWEKFTFFNNVIQPKSMSFNELDELMKEAWKKIYDIKVLKMKYLKTLKSTKSPMAAGWALSTNVHYRNTVFEGIEDDLSNVEIYEQLTGMKISF